MDPLSGGVRCCSRDKIDTMVGFHALHTTRDAALPRCLGPSSHPDTNARCTVMMMRPYKPRDPGPVGCRSALLRLQYVADARALPCTPEGYYMALRPLTGAAKYAWGARAR
jgi:hypothetical protein